MVIGGDEQDWSSLVRMKIYDPFMSYHYYRIGSRRKAIPTAIDSYFCKSVRVFSSCE